MCRFVIITRHVIAQNHLQEITFFRIKVHKSLTRHKQETIMKKWPNEKDIVIKELAIKQLPLTALEKDD